MSERFKHYSPELALVTEEHKRLADKLKLLLLFRVVGALIRGLFLLFLCCLALFIIWCAGF